mgnify:CR=1 FL=1
MCCSAVLNAWFYFLAEAPVWRLRDIIYPQCNVCRLRAQVVSCSASKPAKPFSGHMAEIYRR